MIFLLINEQKCYRIKEIKERGEVMTDTELKKKIKRAAKDIMYIFENTKITGFKVKDDKVLFFNEKELVYELSKDEILNESY